MHLIKRLISKIYDRRYIIWGNNVIEHISTKIAHIPNSTSYNTMSANRTCTCFMEIFTYSIMEYGERTKLMLNDVEKTQQQMNFVYNKRYFRRHIVNDGIKCNTVAMSEK